MRTNHLRLLRLLAFLLVCSMLAACTVRRGGRSRGDDDDDDDSAVTGDDDDTVGDDDDDTVGDDDDDDISGDFFGIVSGTIEVSGAGKFPCSGEVDMEVSGGSASGAALCNMSEPLFLECAWIFSNVPVNGSGDVSIDCMEGSSVIQIGQSGGSITGTSNWTDNTNISMEISFTADP